MRSLGEGGIATVYRVRDTRLQVERAIKLLHARHAQRADIRARFEREAVAMARIRHPRVSVVHEIGEEAGRLFLVLDLEEGGSLWDHVERFGPLTPRQAATVCLEVLEGLGAAHAVGIVHRDVKPQNVLLTRDGHARITDFGVAHLDTGQQGLTRTGSLMGTLAYMAPEQLEDARTVDARADIYSVGAMIFALFTGDTPWPLCDTSDPAVFEGVPAGLRPIVQRAVEARPADRYPDATAMAEALRGAIPSLPPDLLGAAPLGSAGIPELPRRERSRPPSRPSMGPRPPAPTPRRPGGTWTGCIAGIVLAAAVGLGVVATSVVAVGAVALAMGWVR